MRGKRRAEVEIATKGAALFLKMSKSTARLSRVATVWLGHSHRATSHGDQQVLFDPIKHTSFWLTNIIILHKYSIIMSPCLVPE